MRAKTPIEMTYSPKLGTERDRMKSERARKIRDIKSLRGDLWSVKSNVTFRLIKDRIRNLASQIDSIDECLEREW